MGTEAEAPSSLQPSCLNARSQLLRLSRRGLCATPRKPAKMGSRNLGWGEEEADQTGRDNYNMFGVPSGCQPPGWVSATGRTLYHWEAQGRGGGAAITQNGKIKVSTRLRGERGRVPDILKSACKLYIKLLLTGFYS